ncbi:MAG: secondary thiamine-phosphate synthase enzyme YjbQ [Candidatus Nanopelagicales bacterium]|jgi:secondary thiamine-phosphate synthase enzyme|nr:secondary thiamine-phosphate synthase enzyme YjbQ [Candidatus Nanopelagicales bacterium]MDP4906366.1 secondary thiamine-phosphate synthase enzyme YjbQ [Candidatus Nanopelagicales bacterium]MDP4974044.1 secondary thiamine-phosphate synthase enzyme YjbQ [Candidatus Nanopelagicales bacterium]
MDSELLEFTTGGRLTTDITAAAADFCRGRGDGLLQVFVPHATAGVAIFETGSRSEEDLELILESVLPRGASYLHRHGSPGHGRDHVLPALVAPSITVPVLDGRMQLGTWQSVVLVDPNADNPRRQVRLSFLAG